MKKITLENGKTIEISDEKYAELVPKNNKNWRAEKGGEYFYLQDSDGRVVCVTDDRDALDEYRYNTLNYYRTEKEAEKARERQLAIGLVTRKINELNEDWEADFGDKGQKKYYVYYSYMNKKFAIDYTFVVKQSYTLPYFASEEIAEKILSENEKELSIIWEL